MGLQLHPPILNNHVDSAESHDLGDSAVLGLDKAYNNTSRSVCKVLQKKHP